ncbi:MAG: hypothetical protein E6G00_03000 [Actinobacteria bacterium]|nr:MAG: hypothetical protein E6G00_03000 [Actinomycetota bacterium]
MPAPAPPPASRTASRRDSAPPASARGRPGVGGVSRAPASIRGSYSVSTLSACASRAHCWTSLSHTRERRRRTSAAATRA